MLLWKIKRPPRNIRRGTFIFLLCKIAGVPDDTVRVSVTAATHLPCCCCTSEWQTQRNLGNSFDFRLLRQHLKMLWKRSSYPLEFKLEVVECAGATTIHGAAKKYNVTRKQILTWKGIERAVKGTGNNFPIASWKRGENGWEEGTSRWWLVWLFSECVWFLTLLLFFCRSFPWISHKFLRGRSKLVFVCCCVWESRI